MRLRNRAVRFRFPILALIFVTQFLPVGGAAHATVYNGNPGNYQSLLALLAPGDTLVLSPGTYTQGLTFSNRNGLPTAPITVSGPASGPAAIFNGRSCCNTVSISNSSWLVIENLTLDGKNLAVDGVKAEGTSQFAHHITLDDLTILNHGNNQQIVGINTKCPAWNWIIRRCTIIGAGTGLYLGDSNGTQPFVAGVIEYNLVQNTIGYNMEIKHQIDRPLLPGMPVNAKTEIRHNVWSKASGASFGGNARPCVLVGHWPLTGPGSSDYYEIHGNFFYQNQATTETLFQGEGNVALYQNLFVNDLGAAIVIQPQNDVPKLIRIFNNTVVSKGKGISVTGGSPLFTQEVTANGVFASPPLSGGIQAANITGGYNARAGFLTNPNGAIGSALDLYPIAGKLTGAPYATGSFNTYTNWNIDFNGEVNGGTFRGAYAGEGANPGWPLAMQRKPEPGAVPDGAFAPGLPMTAVRAAADGSAIDLQWGAACHASGYHVVYGGLAGVASHTIGGGECAMTGTAHQWTAVPGGNLWFLVVADDSGDTEGTWGFDSSGTAIGGVSPSGVCGAGFRNATPAGMGC